MKIRSLVWAMACCQVASFVPYHAPRHQSRSFALSLSSGGWQGDVVSSAGGSIQGCSVQQVGESITDWTITIDGNDADLGPFSEAIYRKITADARQQSFQGFRPGTIPSHLEPTYRAFAMDECARETVLEAMQQNDIRPFTEAREALVIEDVSILPPKKKAKKKKGGRKNKAAEAAQSEEDPVEEDPKWVTFESMKGAIDAGWKPGQSFSFVAKNLRGQKVLGAKDVKDARPLGLNYDPY